MQGRESGKEKSNEDSGIEKGRIEGNISNDGEVNECVSAEGDDA